jgi:DNA polymerase elongation subunit (family B)
MRGWILDVTAQRDHMILWLRTTDQCIPLHMPYQPCFYLHAPGIRFEDYAPLLSSHPHVAKVLPEFHRLQLRGSPHPVLAVYVDSCRQFARVVREVKPLVVPRFRLFNSDLPVTQLWLLEQRHYPFEEVEVHTDETGHNITRIDSCGSRLAIDYPLPVFRTVDLSLEGGTFFHATSSEGETLQTTEPLILQDWINTQDPDILFTKDGDARVFPTLIHRARQAGVLHQLSLNRDQSPLIYPNQSLSPGRTLYRYGGPIFYRPHPYLLRGRLHLDRTHMTYDSFDGLVEACRLTSFPPQRAARNSPGTGINMLQMQEALKRGVLIPETKATPEAVKTGTELLCADRGGHTITPRVGVFSDVGEFDFTSMYPSLMVKYNISPDALFCDCCQDDATIVPEVGYRLCHRQTGIVPAFLEPLLKKRIIYKKRRHENPVYDARNQALKWLLVVSFGYLGFRAARFGRVEAYECVTAYARQVLLQTKALCERKGFRVLHGIVDCVWLQKPGTTVEDYVALSDDISEATKLEIEFEGRYRWIMFLPCRGQLYGALTRYCGVKEDGTIKVRGIELRRRDTPPLVKQLQHDLLTRMACAEDADELLRLIPQLKLIVSEYIKRLQNRDVTTEELAITQNISQDPEDYQQRCSQAIAAELTIRYGQELHPGQSVSYVHTNAHARHPLRRVALPGTPDAANYDTEKYIELLLRAADTLLAPLGLHYEKLLHHFSNAPQQTLLQFIPSQQ